MTKTFKVRDDAIEARLYIATPEAEIREARACMAKAQEAMTLFGASRIVVAGNKHGVYVAGFIPKRSPVQDIAKVNELVQFGFLRRESETGK